MLSFLLDVIGMSENCRRQAAMVNHGKCVPVELRQATVRVRQWKMWSGVTEPIMTQQKMHLTWQLQLQVQSCGTAYQLICDKLTLAFNNLSGY